MPPPPFLNIIPGIISKFFLFGVRCESQVHSVGGFGRSVDQLSDVRREDGKYKTTIHNFCIRLYFFNSESCKINKHNNDVQTVSTST